MKKKHFFFIFILVAAILITGCKSNDVGSSLSTNKVQIFKSSSCGCCGIYTRYMDSEGFDVELTNTEDMDSIKNKFNIPSNLQSCHTTVIGDYFVEGHIPSEAIEKLMTEHPDIAGIAMPGMPSGSPGMPGSKYGDFVIYEVHHDGDVKEFMRI